MGLTSATQAGCQQRVAQSTSLPNDAREFKDVQRTLRSCPEDLKEIPISGVEIGVFKMQIVIFTVFSRNMNPGRGIVPRNLLNQA